MDLIAQIDKWGILTGSRAAHVCGAEVLTYAELRERSDRFAGHLSAAIPSDRSPIAVLGHKQAEMLIGFVGSLKAGHSYVPLDTSLPESRVRAIVQAAGAKLFTVDDIKTITSSNGSPVHGSIHSPEAGDLWYIIFTSGSTGEPKGVMITRSCLESFLDWTLQEQAFKESSEVFLNQAPFSFDLSVMDLYSSLATGGTLFSVTQDDVAQPRHLFDALGRSGVTVWVSTPSFARMCLMQSTFNEQMLAAVRKFWFCGETLAPEIAGELLRRFPNAEVWNTYGPTEATVATTSIQITHAVLESSNPLPVGRAKPGSKLLIRDSGGRDLAPGESGEIVISGPNVALGYINRPDLTARSFIEVGGQRAYRTGDAGHMEADVLFFEGRLDFQIKLHGYRIELGDVEANVRKLRDVQDAVVIPFVRDGRAEYLVAFAVLKRSPGNSEFELSQRMREELASRLPEYMVPRKFVFMEALPTTPNGKVDRQQLAGTLA
ncbi:MAG TPA: D-alanine--poly(phosphoribitol) ligase subunit DltA [Anaerolineales bacterium]|nr:D-alanine--poly(phosphoribitol) ligase subunit DltA [Anaerolineales bacterium]